MAFLVRAQQRFDLVLLDPPYQAGFYPDIFAKVAPVCADGAVVLCRKENPCKASTTMIESRHEVVAANNQGEIKWRLRNRVNTF